MISTNNVFLCVAPSFFKIRIFTIDFTAIITIEHTSINKEKVFE